MSFVPLISILFILVAYASAYPHPQMNDLSNNSDESFSPRSFQRKIDDYFSAYHSILQLYPDNPNTSATLINPSQPTSPSHQEQGSKNPEIKKEQHHIKSAEEKREERKLYLRSYRIDARRRKELGLPSRSEEQIRYRHENAAMLAEKRRKSNLGSKRKHLEKIRQGQAKETAKTSGVGTSQEKARKKKKATEGKKAE